MTHLLSCITVGIFFRFWKLHRKSNLILKSSISTNSKKRSPNFSNLGAILQNSIMSSINTILINNTKIFEILELFFAPFLKTINIPSSFASGLFAGLVELTNGVAIISKIACSTISVNIIICAFLLGFGGISILLQVLSITSTSDISIKPYIIR